MMGEDGNCRRWRVTRGAFKPLGVAWSPYVVKGTASTNRLWRGSGPSGEWLLKWYRYPQAGVHPEAEVAEFFRDQNRRGVAEFGARLERLGGDGWSTVAFIQRWLSGVSVWDQTLAAMRSGSAAAVFAADLGRCVGGLHQVLGSGNPGSPFAPVRWSPGLQEGWIDRLSASLVRLQTACRDNAPAGADRETFEGARALCEEASPGWQARVEGLRELRIECEITRIHGDLHLGQILEREQGSGPDRFTVVDFEGEPTRSIAERRAKDLPLRDVAGMFRSFAYAAAVAGVPLAVAASWGLEFLAGWRDVMPVPSGDWRSLLDALIWEKAIYEAEYELRHRPGWLWIPLSALSARF
ncbi:MAG: maltose alpha-D-glucosyltransferase/ alpha-amylase [Verrucomicrobia bacterium]|nr:MAG: maltose alpha-D-glucosyltransferase/ alpha-amylase [Verrucomicrobiota bacterium]